MVRSGSIDEVTAAATLARDIRLSWLGDSADGIQRDLSANPQVANLHINGLAATFQFTGSEDDLAAVLAKLVTSGVRVKSFSEIKQTVEDLYMKLSKHEVM